MTHAARPRTAVIKIGSSTLTDAEGKVDRAYLADLAHQVNRVRKAGWNVDHRQFGLHPVRLGIARAAIEAPEGHADGPGGVECGPACSHCGV